MHPIATLLVSACLATSATGQDTGPLAWARNETASLVTIYRELHQAPELSFHEAETAKRLAAALQAAGFEVTSGIGGHGVVAILENGPGKTLMLRTDLDALPVSEQTGLPYASKVVFEGPGGAKVGVMHACGHDVHMTCLIGVARYLATHKNRWQGTLMLIGQPAEEKVAGAQAMLDQGLFERFKKPDFAVALHVAADQPCGQIGWRQGYAMANVDSVDIEMRGTGGHGSAPHTTVDPIVQAAMLVVDLQTIVSREISPTDPAVITVGSIHGGSKHNIIGETCHLQLTVRSYASKVREQLKEAIVRKAKAVAMGARAPEPKVEFSESCPSLFNDAALTRRVVTAFARELGKESVVEVEPTMGAEDFALFGHAGVPIFMYRLGSVPAERLADYRRQGKAPPSLHSAYYWPDAEATLPAGVASLAIAALELLGR
jgi:hippurate hydrolase